jgi:hypothetical protein
MHHALRRPAFVIAVGYDADGVGHKIFVKIFVLPALQSIPFSNA